MGGHFEAMLDVTKNILLTFKGICMNFSLELKKIILSHPVTSKQRHKIVQILMGHPVGILSISLGTMYILKSIKYYKRFQLNHCKILSNFQ